jgi:hypothetical protein
MPARRAGGQRGDQGPGSRALPQIRRQLNWRLRCVRVAFVFVSFRLPP